MAKDEQADKRFTAEIVEAIKGGRKVEAIKLLRNEAGLGLKDAKEAVEMYIENNAEIKDAFNANKSSGLSQENSLRLFILAGVLIVVYMLI